MKVTINLSVIGKQIKNRYSNGKVPCLMVEWYHCNVIPQEKHHHGKEQERRKATKTNKNIRHEVVTYIKMKNTYSLNSTK